jgi:guanylate kinase
MKPNDNYEPVLLMSESQAKVNDIATVGENNELYKCYAGPQWKKVGGGTDTYSKEEIDNKTKKICIVDLKGLKEIKKYYGEENLVVIFIDAADEIRQRRAMRRGSFDKSEWYRRLKDDNKKFKDFEYDYKIMNNKTQTELEYKVCDILRKEDLI